MCAERHGDHATTEEEREIDRLRDENATLRGRVLTLEARAERTELAEAEVQRARFEATENRRLAGATLAQLDERTAERDSAIASAATARARALEGRHATRTRRRP